MKNVRLSSILAVLFPVLVHAQSYTWSTLAGLPPQVGTADGSANDARFHYPTGLVSDPAGNLYVCDTFNHTIRKVAPDGSATTLAGLAGVSGTADGIGAAARFNNPQGIAIDAARNLYVADRLNFTVRKITPAGAVTTLAGLARSSGSTDGTGGGARFNNPWGIAVAADGTVYVSDRLNHTIRKVTANGDVTTCAGLVGTVGSTDGPALDARFNFPSGLTLGPDGSLFVADSNNYTVRRIAPDGIVSTFAGTARISGTTNATGAAARFTVIYELAFDAAGDLYVADFTYNRVRKISPAAEVSTFAGNSAGRGSVNGTGLVARFFQPNGIARGADGNI